MAQSEPLHESDLIFSSAASVLKDALGELKRTNLSIKNRLRSIKKDAEFVCNVADAYQLPLMANERCGSWYIPPERKAGSAYFKSTDGHFHQWAFSLRRLNLQVLDVIHEHGGCIIVDSTRRGKIMPDALSKTVPIWVFVLNQLLFPDLLKSSQRLSSPLYVVSESEYAQISARLDGFVNDVRALGLDLESLPRKLRGKPMKVTWEKPGDTLPETPPRDEKRNLIVLCTASNETSLETSATSEYVQGAADDPESWSLGLDATQFWRNEDQLLEATEDELPTLIEGIVMDSKANVAVRQPILIRPTGNIWIGNNAAAEEPSRSFDLIISCTTQPVPALSEKMKEKYLTLACPPGKLGSRQLRTQLSKLRDLIQIKSDDKVLVTCDTGRNLAVGTALALLCLFYDAEGTMPSHTESLDTPSGNVNSTINKTMIKQRLSWIMVCVPDASPSRATLQSVNAFLMG